MEDLYTPHLDSGEKSILESSQLTSFVLSDIEKVELKELSIQNKPKHKSNLVVAGTSTVGKSGYDTNNLLVSELENENFKTSSPSHTMRHKSQQINLKISDISKEDVIASAKLNSNPNKNSSPTQRISQDTPLMNSTLNSQIHNDVFKDHFPSEMMNSMYNFTPRTTTIYQAVSNVQVPVDNVLNINNITSIHRDLLYSGISQHNDPIKEVSEKDITDLQSEKTHSKGDDLLENPEDLISHSKSVYQHCEPTHQLSGSHVNNKSINNSFLKSKITNSNQNNKVDYLG